MDWIVLDLPRWYTLLLTFWTLGDSVSSVNGSCVMSTARLHVLTLFFVFCCAGIFCLSLFSLYFFNVKKRSKAIKPNKKIDLIGLYDFSEENMDSSEKLEWDLVFVSSFTSGFFYVFSIPLLWYILYVYYMYYTYVCIYTLSKTWKLSCILPNTSLLKKYLAKISMAVMN